MTTLEELAKSSREATLVRQKKEDLRNNRKWDLKQHYDAIITAQLEEEFGTSISDAITAEREAEDALRLEQDRIAQSGTNALFPIGTRFIKKPNSFTSLTQNILGVYEILSLKSEHPDNIADCSRAKIGDHVIRLLKKDGTPSKKYEKFSYEYMGPEKGHKPSYGWRLESEVLKGNK